VFVFPIFPGAPTWRPNAGGWTNIALPRIIAITWLDRLAFTGSTDLMSSATRYPPG